MHLAFEDFEYIEFGGLLRRSVNKKIVQEHLHILNDAIIQNELLSKSTIDFNIKLTVLNALIGEYFLVKAGSDEKSFERKRMYERYEQRQFNTTEEKRRAVLDIVNVEMENVIDQRDKYNVLKILKSVFHIIKDFLDPDIKEPFREFICDQEKQLGGKIKYCVIKAESNVSKICYRLYTGFSNLSTRHIGNADNLTLEETDESTPDSTSSTSEETDESILDSINSTSEEMDRSFENVQMQH